MWRQIHGLTDQHTLTSPLLSPREVGPYECREIGLLVKLRGLKCPVRLNLVRKLYLFSFQVWMVVFETEVLVFPGPHYHTKESIKSRELMNNIIVVLYNTTKMAQRKQMCMKM